MTIDVATQADFSLTEYFLLRFVHAAGGHVEGRKRLQKVMFLLKAEGLGLADPFRFHFYGPYSGSLAQELRRLSDRSLPLLEQRGGPSVSAGSPYEYRITDHGRRVLEDYNRKLSPSGDALSRFEERFTSLVRHDVWRLELASTIVYWVLKGYDLAGSVERTAQLKRVGLDDRALSEARELAKDSFARRAVGANRDGQGLS
jgi:hypothetical protein